MSARAVFIQECPICGRPLKVRKEYHGKKVSCLHCGGRFRAVDAARDPWSIWDQDNLLDRADQLLEQRAAGSAFVY